jgi:hypothetical protein
MLSETIVALLIFFGTGSIYADQRHHSQDQAVAETAPVGSDQEDQAALNVEQCSTSTVIEMADGKGVIFLDGVGMFENGVSLRDREAQLAC